MLKVKAGMAAPQSGLYRCTRCGYEMTLKEGDIVPTCPQCGNKEFEFVR